MKEVQASESFSNPGQALSWASRVLKGCGVPDHEQEAEYLLTSLLDVKRHELYISPEKTLTPGEASRFREYVMRRCRREPAQYITGEAWFRGLKLKVTPATLIPRPETELLVDEALRAAAKGAGAKKTITALDLCTGTGCIAISIAAELPGAEVFATDISAQALCVARENAQNNGVAGNIDFIEGDLFAPLYGTGLEGNIDLILSNPPYIPEKDIAGLEPEVKDHEPLSALRAGIDGLDFYRRIIAQAPVFLSPGGYLIMELGWDQARKVLELAKTAGAFEDISIKKDYSGIERVFAARAKR